MASAEDTPVAVLPEEPLTPAGAMPTCEDEPIRIPGSIQRHGFLLLLDESDQHVVAASQNTEEFLDIPATLVAGTPVEAILEREVLAALRGFDKTPESPGLLTYLGAFRMRGRFFSVVTHRVGNERLLEFELTDRLVSPDMTAQVFTNFVGKLNNLLTESELCQALTDQVKTLTGFNRVMLYRFDEFGHGTVRTEATDGVLPSYLDLRFPASDIPQQARDLYVLNTVRIIPNAMYVPSPLYGAGGRKMTGLDLSMSILRSVSPVHLEYMRNMGTMSSMSISIVCDGKLWGLVSGHHAEPHTVPYMVRSACDLLTRLVSTQLTSLSTSEGLKQSLLFHSVQRRVVTGMAAEKNFLTAIASQMEDVAKITNADGAALVTDGQCTVFGTAPQQSDIRKIAEWLDKKPDLDVFHSRHLAEEMEGAADFSELASGLLAIRISYVRQSYLMWFRPELIRTVRWAGEPTKSSPDATDRLNPRKSFESWKELVRGSSKPWTDVEIESATEFRTAATTISLKRAEEAVQLGEARFLQLTNALPHPVWTANDDGQLTYVNQKWLDQGLGNRGRWFEQERLASEDQARCTALWNSAVAEGTSFELELRFRSPTHPAGQWNLVRAIPYLRADGTRAGWAGTCTDLMDRRQREETLRMTEKLALTGRMTSVIAHEINNPLEAITNLLYLLSGHVKDNGPARNYVAQAESELQRISGITKQTLRWSKDHVLKPDYGIVGDLFSDVLRLFAGQIRNRNVQVLVESGEQVRFYGTASQLSQVLANLLANSIQAVAVGGHIWLNAHPAGESIEILVRDDGEGMSEETLQNLFQPFYSTKGDLGNGLGLYISQEIVERHGGRIIVTSHVGGGAEVRVVLPATAR